MKLRIVAIINENAKAVEHVKMLAKSFNSSNCEKTVIFSKYAEKLSDAGDGVEVILIPEEKNSRPKMKNFVTKHFKDAGYTGMLHVIEDRIDLTASPTLFMDDIENMMKVYGLNNWLDTVTDTCNYLYSKYNPRLDISIDDPAYSKLGISNAIFCSHSNVQWTVFNLEKADDNELYYCEDFEIDMFFIIEFLARRRNTHPNSLYFMNLYYTCKSEKGLFAINLEYCDEVKGDDSDKMKKEDAIFKSKNVNYAPDNNIDRVLELLYEKLKQSI